MNKLLADIENAQRQLPMEVVAGFEPGTPSSEPIKWTPARTDTQPWPADGPFHRRAVITDTGQT